MTTTAALRSPGSHFFSCRSLIGRDTAAQFSAFPQQTRLLMDADARYLDYRTQLQTMMRAFDRIRARYPCPIRQSASIKSNAGQSPRFGRLMAAVTTSLSDVFNGPSARPGCIPAITTERGPTQSLPATQAQPSLTPEEINPGLAPGINTSPQDVPTGPSAGNKLRRKISSD
jgi:hypothetical protein